MTRLGRVMDIIGGHGGGVVLTTPQTKVIDSGILVATHLSTHSMLWCPTPIFAYSKFIIQGLPACRSVLPDGACSQTVLGTSKIQVG